MSELLDEPVEPETVWVYLDETAYDDPFGIRWRGAGALALREPMSSEAVDSALVELANDPDAQEGKGKALDAKTLSRRRFHASEESPPLQALAVIRMRVDFGLSKLGENRHSTVAIFTQF